LTFKILPGERFVNAMSCEHTGVGNIKFKKLFILVTVHHLAEFVCIGVGVLRHNCNKRRRNQVELIFLLFHEQRLWINHWKRNSLSLTWEEVISNFASSAEIELQVIEQFLASFVFRASFN
jgi:hypothetical protein